MRAIVVRFMVSAVGLGLGGILFPAAVSKESVLAGAIMLTILYIILRPLMQVFILLPNMLLLGMVTPFADALFLLWTSAWVNGMALGYWQAVAIALLMSVLYYPYSAYTQKRLGSDEYLKAAG